MNVELVETPEQARTDNNGYNKAPDTIDVSPVYGYTSLYDFINKNSGLSGNPATIIILLVLIILYYVLFYSLGQPTMASAGQMQQPPSAGIQFIEILMWALFIFLIMANALQYFFSVDIRTAITDIFSPEPQIDIDVSHPDGRDEPIPEITYEKQVFHIPKNVYTYDDAKALCKAFGARLATYQEVEDAYNKGAEWCSYGWSDGQMVLFPTQEKTWKRLQKTDKHKHSCGRPGVNGGYIDNPNAKFGVNCYGYRPEMNREEQQLMRDEPLVPPTKEERKFNEKVKRYRNKLENILVSPFNRSHWSKI